ncbi:MAG: hypothetical protein KDB95_13735, partial [Flavobacteriales bacterium]|nr:hypothetical protein [Flavobacteriales bacterium]
QNGTIAFAPLSDGLLYQWDDPAGQQTATASGLAAGTYSVTVSDALGCDTTLSATVTEPSVLAVTQVSPTDATCNGGTNGAINLVVVGGTPNYSISWSNGASGTGIVNLLAGEYSALVTDAQGCTTQATGTVGQPDPIVVTTVVPDTVCVNTTNTFSASASGGAGGYIFNWGGLGYSPYVQLAFQNSQTILLTVVDQNGCAGPDTPVPVTVLDLASANITSYGDTTTCINGVASVGVDVSGYPGSYSIAWTPLGYSGPGPYSVPIAADQDLVVTVIDECGNSVERTVALRLDIAPNFQLPAVIAEGCAPLHVQFPALNLGNVLYTWNLGNGQTSHVTAPEVIYPQGNYQASLSVTTPLGCTSTSTNQGVIHAFGHPIAAFSASPLSTTIDEPVVDFTDQSTGTIVSYDWVFGDGGTSSMANPS